MSLKDLTDQQLIDYFQLLKNLTPREQSIHQCQFDTKFAYHCVRLLQECQQILTKGDIDLQQDNELLKAIRRGEYTEAKVVDMIDRLMRDNDAALPSCKLPETVNWKFAQATLMNILESHYGSLQAVVTVDRSEQILSDLSSLLLKYKD